MWPLRGNVELDERDERDERARWYAWLAHGEEQRLVIVGVSLLSGHCAPATLLGLLGLPPAEIVRRFLLFCYVSLWLHHQNDVCG